MWLSKNRKEMTKIIFVPSAICKLLNAMQLQLVPQYAEIPSIWNALHSGLSINLKIMDWLNVHFVEIRNLQKLLNKLDKKKSSIKSN
jgi:hypothetical protein